MDNSLAKDVDTIMETSTPSGCKGTVARICSSSRIYILFLHAVVLLLMAVLLKDSRAISSTKTGQGATWSPAQDVISYDTRGRYSTKDQQSIYAGLPRPDHESAWAELITPIYIRISRDELLKAEEPLGENTTMLKDGGYPAILGAYHELHCVRQLRFFLYQEHYYPNLTMPERALLVHHLDHCLEALRLTVMCHGSTELYTFAWHDPPGLRPKLSSKARTLCVNWNALEEWSRSRMLPIDPELVWPEPGFSRND